MTDGSRPQIAEWVIGTWLSHVHALAKYTMDKETETWAPKISFPTFGTDSVGRRMYVDLPSSELIADTRPGASSGTEP